MLDLDWERSIPILDVKIDEIKSIFTEYDNTLTVTDFNAIQLGCKNSNFVVCTNKGKFLLRIANKSGFNNEIIAYELVKGKINIPNLLFHTTKDKANIFVYQYINGVSLQKRINHLFIVTSDLQICLLTNITKCFLLIGKVLGGDIL